MPSLPGSIPPSLSSVSSVSSSPPTDMARAARLFVWVRCLTRPPTEHLSNDQWPAWLTACYQLTPYLQRFGVNSALLNLGPCADAEAVAVVQALITRLAHQQITLCAAIAPSGILTQLALFRLLHTQTSLRTPLTLLPPEQVPDLLRQLPISALACLRFADPTIITTRTLTGAVSWLEDYGVRTLAHLTRLEGDFLRRQFGARLGVLLAAVARGSDLLPFQPTPAPLRLRFRLRLKTPVSAGCLVAGLAPFTLEVASALARRGLQGHTLELRLRWETGISECIARTLPQPIAGGRVLNETLRRLLMPIFQRDASAPTHTHTQAPTPDTHDAIEDFYLIVSHLVPRYPAQHTFWQQRTRRVAAVQELADVLTHRYGKPLLFKRLLTAPDAIFDQDRSRLAPLNADAVGTADVLEDQGHGGGRLTTDVADATDTSGTSADISHGIHWW